MRNILVIFPERAAQLYVSFAVACSLLAMVRDHPSGFFFGLRSATSSTWADNPRCLGQSFPDER